LTSTLTSINPDDKKDDGVKIPALESPGKNKVL